jgi:endonuclease-3
MKNKEYPHNTSPSQKETDRSARASLMANELKKLFPKRVGTALHYSTPWELIVAVVLSAQSRDVKVNEVTPHLFATYPDVTACARANLDDFDTVIKSINYHTTKSKNLIKSAQIISEKYNGLVPSTMEELMTLPGVGRKSANVVLSNAFNDSQGIAVDTHVRRFSLKFELTSHSDPLKIEQDLMKLLPKSEWFDFHNNLIFYGREICPARPHECVNHPLTRLYPQAAYNWPKSKI